jgi:hypothetical protein
MSAPVKKGGYVSGYDEVVSGDTVISSGGYVFSVGQKQVQEPAANLEEALPAADLKQFADTLDNSQKEVLLGMMQTVDGEIKRGEGADVEVVQAALQDISRMIPGVRAPLRAYIENNTEAIRPIKIVARSTLAE